MKKIISLIICFCLGLLIVGCGNTPVIPDNPEIPDIPDDPTPVVEEEEDNEYKKGYSLTDNVEYTYPLGFITGVASPNYTTTTAVGGTDLGFPVYDESKDRMYFVFGDTFSKYGTNLDGLEYNSHMTGNWRSDTVGYVDNYSTSDFLKTRKFTGWITDNNGMATAMNQGWLITKPDNEGTKIPTGGIFVNGAFYIFYMSIQRFSSLGGKWFCNYCGAIKSTDDGATWSRVYDLTWFSNEEVGRQSYADYAKNHSGYDNFDAAAYYDQIKYFAEQSVMNYKNDNIPTREGELVVEDRIAPNFMQIAPVDGKDGYIYIFGSQGGREDGMQLGRVKVEDFENFNKYEYFTGYDAKNNATWMTYEEGGLAYISKDIKINSLSNHDGYKNNPKKNNSTNKTFVISTIPVGETTVFYNPYLKRWMMTSNFWNAIYMYQSKSIAGPYKVRQLVFTSAGTTEGKPYDWANYQSKNENDYDYATITSKDSEFGRRSFLELYSGFGHEKMCTEDGKMYIVGSFMDRIYNSFLLEVKFY